jgi:hypothetical protein
VGTIVSGYAVTWAKSRHFKGTIEYYGELVRSSTERNMDKELPFSWRELAFD